jgi:DMSO/TMAO reductase YedYZ molybdopterin-dependent catalytic subunit
MDETSGRLSVRSPHSVLFLSLYAIALLVAASAASASGLPQSRAHASLLASRSPAPSFKVCGNVRHTTTFTVARLEKMRTVSATYFSIGGHPTTKQHTHFVGVRLINILKVAGLKKGAKTVTVRGSDGYSATFTLKQVKATYIDQTRPHARLYMIIAYKQGHKLLTGRHPFRVVMGQQFEGDYNRMYWVYWVTTITVR